MKHKTLIPVLFLIATSAHAMADDDWGIISAVKQDPVPAPTQQETTIVTEDMALYARAMEAVVSENEIDENMLDCCLKNLFSREIIYNYTPYDTGLRHLLAGLPQEALSKTIAYYKNTRRTIPNSTERLRYFEAEFKRLYYAREGEYLSADVAKAIAERKNVNAE